ncbi:MAG: tRNA (guanosine(37)-N1)-methyltransferase TrmD, partial [Dolichospermum sp.]
WRFQQQIQRTASRRPDLLEKWQHEREQEAKE